jgi:predicted transport protein
MNLKYVKFDRILLKGHSEYNETWVQDRIAEDPSILGMGDLILKDRERTQPKAGRLDILLQDPDSSRRYEVEVQLGPTDESHIIRTIEYWDIERKRYPQYDHTAVIVSEEITSRFLNVIGLFNGFIPLVAIQMHAMKCGDQLSLICTKVLDQMTLGTEEEDDEFEVVDRSYWDKRATKETVALVDTMLDLIHVFDPTIELNYTKVYIGLSQGGHTNNFVVFKPQKTAVRLEVRLAKSEEVDTQLQEKGLDLIDYTTWGRYRIRLSKADIKDHAEFLKELMRKSYEQEGE